MKIIKDGSSYLVARDNFVNLQESKDYFFIEKKELEDFWKSFYQECTKDCEASVLRYGEGCVCGAERINGVINKLMVRLVDVGMAEE